jgi:hypothetical protein
MTATRQVVTHIRELRRFESMYTLQEKTWYTWHVRFWHQSTYTTRTLLTGSPRTCQPFASHQQSWTDPLPLRERAPIAIHSMPVDRSMSLYLASLPQQPLKQWRKVKHLSRQASVGNKLHRFTRLISPACYQYVQYLLEGTNP